MKYFRKAVFLFLLIALLILENTVFAIADSKIHIKNENTVVSVSAPVELNITARSAILMEASTGTVLYDKNSNEKVSPASITKIMTLLLIFDSLDSGRITLEDEVVTSEHAKSMGGSQVFLEVGEIQTVETLIKCIVVASGNDASVAMAEYIAGSEAEFVKMMNERANGLGMKNTHFEDCCGLTDSDNHYSSAHDVAIMSRELITKYPQIKNYSGIWMENIVHVTNKGSEEFGLANTNKLLKQYEYATGLKTGSTSKAKYCVSATATKNDVEMIAVIMAAPDYKVRFSEAKILLEYGFNTCEIYKDAESEYVWELNVNGGKKEKITAVPVNQFSYICKDGEKPSDISKEVLLPEEINSPVEKGDKVGEIVYKLNGKEIGKTDIIANEGVEKADYIFNLLRVIGKSML
ncbi:MAG: D-alanyl-D-alanine carboxypeptidase [Lachnospiraceae bacterium]|nr:D-alanyl-D-alanine carboxypeptidase [Lachnospiraceae bacterium]